MSCLPIEFPPKHPQDGLTLEFSFDDALPDGYVLESAGLTATVSVLAGADPDPDTILEGTPYLSDDLRGILLEVGGGLVGCAYLITVSGNWGPDLQGIAMDGFFRVQGGLG